MSFITRSQFYVAAAYSSTVSWALTAYTYTNNSTITQLWQRTDSALGVGNNVAIAPSTGNIYVANNSTVSELSSSTGATLRSLSGLIIPNGSTPIISNGNLWIDAATSTGTPVIDAISLSTFTLVAQIPGGKGNNSTSFQGPGALAPGALLVDYGTTSNQLGFQVYTIPTPEPGQALLIAAVGLGLVTVGARAARRSRIRHRLKTG